ncbi:hypothetical protein F66182_1391 [Fusarium sp. NRRL 66182]|nr:hypothetical protein F66182_1391 [Fusarium sp. NRRL 66182]
MPSLDRLPNEVLHSIASFLHKKYDLAALSRVNRHCYDIASPILWKREARSDRPGALHWAVEHEDIRLLRRALEAGVSPSRLAYTHRPKPRIDQRHRWWDFHSTYYDNRDWELSDTESVDLDSSYVLHDTCGCFESGCDDGIFSDCRWEAIHVAASKGRIDMVEVLLDAGASIEAPSWGVCLCRPHLPIDAFTESQAVDEEELEDLHGGNWTPLHVAICHGEYETAKFLLERGASTVIYQGIDFELDPNAWGDDEVARDSSRFRLTAMHHAAKHNMLDLLRLLVEEKYQEDVNVEGPFMGTPLLQATWYGHWDTVVPYLIEHGAKINARLIETRLTPLMMACFSRRFDDAAKLIDLGADVTTLSVHRFSILHLILGPRQLRPEDFFDPSGPPPEPQNKITEAEIIEKFIARGFDVNAREALLGMTPLMVASASCNTDAMQALLDGGADVNALDHDGLTALARVGEAAEGSAILGLCDAGRMLLDAGATMEDSMDEVTPLNIICSRRCEPYFSRDWDSQHAALAKLLIERGANPNEKGMSVSRPFTEAIIHGNLNLAGAILEYGGRPEKGDLEQLLSTSVYDPYDDGKTEFILLIDYAKYNMASPSDAFLVRLLKTALDNQLWSRAADLMKAVPTPRDLRKGLIHRCLQGHSPTSDEPSRLIQVLLERGEDPNELFNGEPPLYYSFRSGSCWRTTPVLVNGGADVHMATESMPHGALMYSITHGYQPQVIQILAKHPDALREKPEWLHEKCWVHLIFRQPSVSHKRGQPRGAAESVINWTFTSRLISAGLRTDIKTVNNQILKELVEKEIPKREPLRIEGQRVLEALDIPYVEPTLSDMCSDVHDDDKEDEEDDEIDQFDLEDASVSDDIDDDDSDLDSDGYDGLGLFHPFMGESDGEADEESEEEQGDAGWNGNDHSSDFDDYDEGGPMPIPVPLLFGLLM